MVTLPYNVHKNVLQVLCLAPKLADCDATSGQRQGHQLAFRRLQVADPDLPADPAVLREHLDAGHPGLAAQAGFHRRTVALDSQGEQDGLTP